MAVDVFVNDPVARGTAWSTLASGYTSGATSLSITSNTPYPSADPTASPATQFRFRIDNELFVCTDNRTTTWTVAGAQGGSSAASHSSGATVTHVVSKTTLDGFVQVAGLSNIGMALYGDGSDGSVTLDGSTNFASFSSRSGTTYTLSRDVFFTDLTINSGVTLITNGYQVFWTGTLTGGGSTAVIQWNGAAGAANGGAAASTSNSTGSVSSQTGSNAPGAAGGAGNTGSGTTGSGADASGFFWTFGGAGGAGGAGSSTVGGGAGGRTLPNARFASALRHITNLLAPFGGYSLTSANPWVATGGSGGGGGGGDATNKGGGGGAGGGLMLLAGRKFAGTGAVQARGGAGGTPTTGNCGGGGGGGGGVVGVISASVVSSAISGWTIDANGGAAGSGVGTGVAGSAGSAGATYLIAN